MNPAMVMAMSRRHLKQVALNPWSCLWLLIGLLLAQPAWGRGGGGCLEQGTPVLTPSGPVAVERLAPGDAVWSVVNGKIRAATVQVRLEVQPEEYVELSVAGRVLRLTPEHPVQIGPGVFRIAAELRAGDTVWSIESDRIQSVTLRSARRIKAEHAAYNLLVLPGGTFLAEGVVVHNKGCFLPDTPVLRTDGSAVPISQLRPGDAVLAFTSEEKVVAATVQYVLSHQVDEYFIVTTERAVLRVTGEHPFFVGAGTFKTLESLRAGDSVFARDGTTLRPQRILRLERVRAPVVVFNLQTDAPHTFFAHGVAVHNKGGGGGGGFSSGGRSGSGGGEDVGMQLSKPTLRKVQMIAGLIGVIFGFLIVRKSNLGGSAWWVALGTIVGAGVAMVIVLIANSSVFGAILCMIVPVCLASVFETTRRDEELDFLYAPGQIRPKAGKTRKLLEFIAKVDDTFEEAKLKSQAEATFRELQKCWQAREYQPMKELLMANLHADHVKHLAGLTRNHEIDTIEGLLVLAVDIVNVRYTHPADEREFTALITAMARDYYVDDRTGKFLRGDKALVKFQEFWTFQLQHGRWLLREIEQSGESDILKDENFFEQFTDQGVRNVYQEQADQEGPAGPWLEPGTVKKAQRLERLLNFLVHTDKLWNRQHMLEGARRCFLSVMRAREANAIDAGTEAILFPEVTASLRGEIAGRQATGLVLELRNLCVRKVELVHVANRAENNRDEFTVRITAHAQRGLKRGTVNVSQQDYVTAWEEYWTFGRLDNAWKLKEVLPAAQGETLLESENVDEDSSTDQLQWYYSKSRAV